MNEDVIVEKEVFDSTTTKLMEKPFNPASIKIENKLLNIDLLIKRISQPTPEIELNTESYFQRKDDLWDVEKQSRLIESILIEAGLKGFSINLVVVESKTSFSTITSSFIKQLNFS